MASRKELDEIVILGVNIGRERGKGFRDGALRRLRKKNQQRSLGRRLTLDSFAAEIVVPGTGVP